jgi:hypothetical protein
VPELHDPAPDSAALQGDAGGLLCCQVETDRRLSAWLQLNPEALQRAGVGSKDFKAGAFAGEYRMGLAV